MDANGSSFGWPGGKRAALSFSFDDARPSQWREGIPILDSHGVRATFYVMPQRVAEELETWRGITGRGHELGNHTIHHPCSGNFRWARGHALEGYTLDQMDQELAEANQWIKEQVGAAPRTFAYPCGQKYVGRDTGVQSYVPLVAGRFLAGRGFRDEAPNDPAFCDLAQLAGVDGDGLTFEGYKTWIDRAIDEGGWLIFAGHDVGSPARQTVLREALDALCGYCQYPANGVWMDTVAAIGDYVVRQRKGFAVE